MLAGKAFMVLLPARIIRNAVMFPIDTIIYFMILKAIEQNVKPMLTKQ